MFDQSTLSDCNKATIHTAFSSSPNWACESRFRYGFEVCGNYSSWATLCRPPSPPTLPPPTPTFSPPLNPGSPATVHAISFTIIIAGTVDAFDKPSFKAKLAGQLDGISPDEISLNVTVASVRVAVIVRARSEAIVKTSLAQLKGLTASIDALSRALDVVVEAVPIPPQSARTQRSMSNENASPSPAGLIAAVCSSVALLLLLIVIAVLTFRRIRKKRTAAHHRPVTTRPIEVAIHPLATPTLHTLPATSDGSDRQRSSIGAAIGLTGDKI